MIKIEKLNLSFKNKQVLKDVDLEINEKDFLIITGESGCGKTSLLNCISMLESYTSGDIVYKNQSYNSLSNKNKMNILKQDFGIVFQDFGMIDELSVYKNLAFVNKDKNQVKKSIEEFNINVELDTKVAVLSGGEKQRLALARIALKKCKVIIADEPTGNLDEENTGIVMDYLVKMNEKGKTVIMVTHDKNLLKYANKVYEL